MSMPDAPKLDTRRTEQFFAELRDRARAWIPSWGFADNEGDFGGALLQIAARFNSEVAQRLDRAGEKMRRGFLDWLAVRGEAAHPSRMPVVFKLSDTATDAVLAKAPVQMQAPTANASVVFETETDINILPGSLQTVVAVNGDALYLPPPGLSDLQPLSAVATEWQLKSFAAAGSTKLQLEPDAGLDAGMIVSVAGTQYTIVDPGNGIAKIDPPLTADLTSPATIRKVSAFAPFDPGVHNAQQHALYVGHTDVLNIDAEATIDVVGAGALADGVQWEFWGTLNDNDDPSWLKLDILGGAATPARVVLHKPKGKVIPTAVNEINSRWIRAYATSVDPAGGKPLLSVDSVTLRVNCTDATTPGGAAQPIDVSGTAEAMDNTTPIVLNSVFFPLGKVPRQFDAFYLGSQEAFSKVEATVQLKFTMAAATFFALSPVREGAFADQVLAGAGADSALHLFAFDATNGSINKFKNREPLRPPAPGYQGKAADGSSVVLDSMPSWRLPTWSDKDPAFGNRPRFAVATTAGNDIWIWLEDEADEYQSGWLAYGSIQDSLVANPTPIAGLVFLAGPPSTQLFALRDQQLWVSDWPGTPNWSRVATPGVNLTQIAPILVLNASNQLVSSATEGMVGVSDVGALYDVDRTGVCTPISNLEKFRIDLQPVAIDIGPNGRIVVSAEVGTPSNLTAFQPTGGKKTTPVGGSAKVVGSVDVALTGGQVYALATLSDGGTSRLATWAPYAGGVSGAEYETDITSAGGLVNWPTFIDKHVVVAGTQGDLHVTDFDPSGLRVDHAIADVGVALPIPVPALAVGNEVVCAISGNLVVRAIKQLSIATQSGETLHSIDNAFPISATDFDVDLLLPAVPFQAIGDGVSKLTIVSGSPAINSHLRVGAATLLRVDALAANVATLSTLAGNFPAAHCTYRILTPTGGRAVSFISFAPPPSWDASLLAQFPLTFPQPGQAATTMHGKAFLVSAGNSPLLVVLDGQLQPPTVGPIDLALDQLAVTWTQLLGDTSTNPDLSWEYSNGRSWGKLDGVTDGTHNLKNSGVVQFSIPKELASSDWAGKTDFWIRARLVGGDYGQEKVTVTTTPLPGGATQQTVERSTDGIRAPSVVRVEISYSICKAVLPQAVLAKDSGTTLDQTDANRTGGAMVEAFVPLPLALERLSPAQPATAAATDCPSDCNCQSSASTAKASGATAAPTTTDASSAAAAQRALFIGLRTTASGASVNVLLIVDEREHSKFTPLTVEALVENQFQTITASDGTRAIGESGLLTLAFELTPTEAELFGQSLTWLRLTPHGTDLSDWSPSIRGAYLNGMWASATETLTRELVGSSDGAPSLQLTLARPPLLANTLELRVREPLGDEDVKALVDKDMNLVKTDPDDLVGNWVLWKQVDDPLDADPQDRVYALSETTGEIQFGDGLHGMIPPIGTDSIVAFRYQRTEPGPGGSDDVPGNDVEPRTALGLVSPLQTVETVIAADQSAGGALPESDDRVIRFGFARLRHRNRAMTAADIEDLILEQLPDIAQARCLLKQGSVQVVVVMRGADPMPGNAQLREFTRQLLTQVPSSLSTSNAVSAIKPGLRKFRIYMNVVVDSLDNAAAVEADVKSRVTSLLDPSTGGAQKEGWLLGASPADEEIAIAMIDVAHLESIVTVTLYEVKPDGTEAAWPTTLLPTELAVLGEDPVRIQFELAQAAV
jgi:hypothetical protein